MVQFTSYLRRALFFLVWMALSCACFYRSFYKFLWGFLVMHGLTNSSKVFFLFQVLLSKVVFITGGTS